MFRHQIPRAKVRQTPYSLFKPLFSGCVCKEVTTVKDTKAKCDPLMGRPEENSREKVYTFPQKSRRWSIHSKFRINPKFQVTAYGSGIVTNGYFKFWQKRNTLSIAQVLSKIISQTFNQLSLLLIPICSPIYRWIFFRKAFLLPSKFVSRENTFSNYFS